MSNIVNLGWEPLQFVMRDLNGNVPEDYKHLPFSEEVSQLLLSALSPGDGQNYYGGDHRNRYAASVDLCAPSLQATTSSQPGSQQPSPQLSPTQMPVNQTGQSQMPTNNKPAKTQQLSPVQGSNKASQQNKAQQSRSQVPASQAQLQPQLMQQIPSQQQMAQQTPPTLLNQIQANPQDQQRSSLQSHLIQHLQQQRQQAQQQQLMQQQATALMAKPPSPPQAVRPPSPSAAPLRNPSPPKDQRQLSPSRQQNAPQTHIQAMPQYYPSQLPLQMQYQTPYLSQPLVTSSQLMQHLQLQQQMQIQQSQQIQSQQLQQQLQSQQAQMQAQQLQAQQLQAQQLQSQQLQAQQLQSQQLQSQQLQSQQLQSQPQQAQLQPQQLPQQLQTQVQATPQPQPQQTQQAKQSQPQPAQTTQKQQPRQSTPQPQAPAASPVPTPSQYLQTSSPEQLESLSPTVYQFINVKDEQGDPNKTKPLTERQKNRRRASQNLASRNYRQRKKEYITTMEDRSQDLERQNEVLRRQLNQKEFIISKLNKENQQLRASAGKPPRTEEDLDDAEGPMDSNMQELVMKLERSVQLSVDENNENEKNNLVSTLSSFYGSLQDRHERYTNQVKEIVNPCTQAKLSALDSDPTSPFDNGFTQNDDVWWDTFSVDAKITEEQSVKIKEVRHEHFVEFQRLRSERRELNKSIREYYKTVFSSKVNKAPRKEESDEEEEEEYEDEEDDGMEDLVERLQALKTNLEAEKQLILQTHAAMSKILTPMQEAMLITRSYNKVMRSNATIQMVTNMYEVVLKENALAKCCAPGWELL